MAVVSNGTTIIDAGVGIGVGKMTLIKTLTASSSATLSFVDGTDSVVLDDTYDTYVFKFINIHPATDNVAFKFNASTDSGSNYNVTKTTTWFRAFHHEDNSNAALGYDAGDDLAQGTGFQTIFTALGGGSADESGSGTLTLYNPSSTTFVKNFIADGNEYHVSNLTINIFAAGYMNTTSAVNAIRFQMSSGNIDAGVIKLYGIGG